MAVGSPIATVTLDQQIGDFASLVGLALVLVVLFTNRRSEALARRPAELKSPTPEKLLREASVDGAVLVLTVALTIAAAPLFADAVDELSLFQVKGAVRTAFAVVWLGLLGLIVWQLSIVFRTLGQRSKVKGSRKATR